ncbi:MAG: S-layer homology domain-containing protein [Clostridia bacterium]|nr:S-layer homology domain-containing protein [Clostridia bacterium]
MKKIISLFIAIVMLAAAIAVALPVSAKSVFSDVEDGRWSASSISYAVNNGYMNGVGGGKFDPTGSLTRAMVATVLWRREGSPKPTAPSGFSDVPAGAWYADAVAWAKETGVVNGMTATTFSPNGYITREQLATMLFRFSSSAPVSVPERADLTPFADDEKTSGWAKESLEWAVEAGLINGTDGNRLLPSGNATREQFAAIIERYDNSFRLTYNEPVVQSHYTEKEYPKADGADFFVSPSGSDENDGSFERPFASFERSVVAVRELKKTKTSDITVAFMGGTYPSLSAVLTAEDSGSPGQRITYCAYGDGEPVFKGGVTFTADEFSDLTAEEAARFTAKAAQKIRKINLGAMVNDISHFRMYGEDGILYPARYPNKYPDGTDQLIMAATTVSHDEMMINQRIMKNKLEGYADRAGLKIYGFLTYGWHKETLSVGDYDPETGIFNVPDASSSYFAQLSGAPGLRYMAEQDGGVYTKEDVTFAFVNMPEDLDYDGEYILDESTGTLYVYNPKGEYVIPQETTNIRLFDANCITLRGFTFLGSVDAPVRATSSCGLYLDDCRFKVTAGNEFVVVERAVRGTDLDFRLTGCEFEMAPYMAVRVHPQQNGADRFDYPVTGVYDNNRFSKIGIGQDGGVALFIRDHDSARISHNEFEDCARYAITYGGCNNLIIEYNVFRRCMYNSDDGGVIYNGNDREEYNNVVRYNLFLPTSWYGMYVDDGGVGVEAYGNLFYEVGSSMVVHDGRDNSLHDNVLINSGVSITYGMYQEFLNDLNSGRADFTSGESRWFGFYQSWLDLFRKIESNEKYRETLMRERPEVFDLSTDPSDALSVDFVLSQYNVLKNNVSLTKDTETDVFAPNAILKDHVVSEGNRIYGLNDNPIFVNPTKGDYRIKDGADFMDIHFDIIGRY